MKQPIAIIGSGHIGNALAFILKDKNIQIRFWDIAMQDQKTLEETVMPALIIFLCVPSWANRNIAKKIASIKSIKKKIIITLSKGLEEKTMLFMDQVLKSEFGNKHDYGILAGPMLAQEIMEGKMSAATLAISNTSWKTKLQSLFKDTTLHITFSSDTHGTAICSVFKNIYTIAMGCIDALGVGANAKGFFTVKAINEMRLALKTLDGKEKTLETPAGIADFLATGWSGISYNYRIGQEIVNKKEQYQRSEGCVAVPPAQQLLKKNLKKFPILHTLKKIIMDKKNVKAAFSSLFKKI